MEPKSKRGLNLRVVRMVVCACGHSIQDHTHPDQAKGMRPTVGICGKLCGCRRFNARIEPKRRYEVA